MVAKKHLVPVVMMLVLVCSIPYWRSLYSSYHGNLENQIAMLSSTVERLRSDIKVLNNPANGTQHRQAPETPYVIRAAQAPQAVQEAQAPQVPHNSVTTLHPSVNVIPSSPTSPLPYKDCVPLPRSATPGAKICIYPPEKDIWISKELKRGGLWEGDLVAQMLQALRADPNMQLVDIGANIGVFSMSAAAAGFDVLAVEMMPANAHMLQHSLHESGLGSKATLVNNAVYSDHRTMGTKAYSGNVGGTALDFNNSTHGSVMVKTICMDDLVPLLKHKRVYIKMDIETAELKALSCSYKFFEQIDVRYLMMEWRWRTKDDTDFAKKFFNDHGMKASERATQYIPANIDVDVAKHNNVFFIRS